MPNSPILVTGTHRSGTTWVGQMLSLDKHVLYIHEPFNFMLQKDRGRNVPVRQWYEAVGGYDEKRQFAVFSYLLAFQSFAPKNLLYNSYKRQILFSLRWIKRKLFPGTRFLYKDPLALLSAPWIHEKMGANIVVLIRHPAAFAASLKVKGWYFPFHDLADQADIMDKLPEKWREGVLLFVAERPGVVEQACLLWNILHFFILEYRKKYPDWLFVRHEDISRFPSEQFKILYEKLGLSYSARIENQILKSTAKKKITKAGKTNILERDSVSNIYSWKKRLTPQEITFIKSATAGVWNEFYSEDDW